MVSLRQRHSVLDIFRTPTLPRIKHSTYITDNSNLNDSIGGIYSNCPLTTNRFTINSLKLDHFDLMKELTRENGASTKLLSAKKRSEGSSALLPAQA